MIKLGKIRIYTLILILIITSCPISVFAADTEGNQENALLTMTNNSLQQETTTPEAIDIEWDEVQGNGFKVEFKVKDKWEGNYNAELIITNTQDAPLENWAFQFDLNAEISNIWGAETFSHEGKTYKIKNVGHNQNIPVGSNIVIGFTASYNGSIMPPHDYQWLSTIISAKDEDYSIEFKILNDWGAGFNGQISITNNMDKAIENWQLEFDFEQEISQFWTAEIVNHTDQHYIIKDAVYNSNINPGDTLMLGFSATPGGLENKPQNYNLSYSIEGIPSSIKVENINNALFASSEDTDAINFRIGQNNIIGNVYTNGGINSEESNVNIQGICQTTKGITGKEQNLIIETLLMSKGSLSIPNLLEYSPFSVGTDKECYIEGNEFKQDELTVVKDTLGLESLSYNSSNMLLNASIMAMNNIEITANKLTTNNEFVFICSANGNIIINVDDINLSCILYAPNGTISITSKDTTLNGKIFGNKVLINSNKFSLVNSNLTRDKNDVINDADELQIKYYSDDNPMHVTQNIILPITGINGSNITWESNCPNIIDASGNVTRPNNGVSEQVKLLGTITKGAESIVKEFEVKVIKQTTYNNLHDNTLDDLALLNDGILPDILNDDSSGVPRFISGKYTDLLVESPEEAIQSLYSVKSLLNIGDIEGEFIWNTTDQMFGDKVFDLQQVYSGIPVYGRGLVVSTYENGEVSSLSGNYNPDVRFAEVETNPSITIKDLKNIVESLYGTNVEIFNNKLVVYSLNISPRLAWIVDVSGKDIENKAIEKEIIVDAISGKIITYYSTIIEENDEFEKRTYNNMVEVEGKGYLDNTTKKFEANMVITQIKIPDGSGGRYVTQEAKYQLFDTTRKIQILEYDKNTDSSYLVENTDGKFNNEIDYGAAVDAYINIRKTYDYYLNTLDRVSFNNNSVPFTIAAEVNFREKPEEPLNNAAFWAGRMHLMFGEAVSGKNSYSTPLDTVAHEYTHAVSYYINSFNYPGVHGSINEAYADILGHLVEGKSTWIHGEDRYTDGSYSRNMENPTNIKDKSPIEVGGIYYWDPTDLSWNDGGRHKNSTIISHIAYKMNTKARIQRDELARIWYRSLRKLKSDATFEDCRLAVLSAMVEEGYNNSEVYTVKTYFSEAGITNLINYENKWYYNDMKSAVTKGIIQGDYIGNLMPEKLVTNAEYITMLSNAYGCNPAILDTEDLPREDWKSHWAKHMIKYAYVQGWINDDFNPDEIITREAAAFYLWESYTRQSEISSNVKNSMKLIERSKEEVWLPKISEWETDSLFEDKSKINTNCEEAIFQLFVNGIYNGYYTDIFGKLNLGPKKALNRAEACAFILRMYEVNREE